MFFFSKASLTVFDTVFFKSTTFDDPESESEDEEEVTTMTDGIDEQEELELVAWQGAKQEEIKQDREKQLEDELKLMKQQMQQMQQQMQQGIAMMVQMQVPRPIIIPQQKALPAPKPKAKLKCNLRKK